MSDCCEDGFSRHCLAGNIWDGTPTGSETKLAGLNVYKTGDNPNVAVLYVHDALGWSFVNTRLVADYYAKELGATVWLPDFFNGEKLDIIHLLDGRFDKIPIAEFTARNSKENRRESIFACTAMLRSQHGFKKVGAVGYCFGGWAVFQLAARIYLADGSTKLCSEAAEGEGQPLVDAISTGHPSWLTKEEIKATKVPTQILAPEHDGQFNPELKAFCNEVIPTLGVEYDYRYFPGLEHAFCTRGSLEVKGERLGAERAKRAVVAWFRDTMLM